MVTRGLLGLIIAGERHGAYNHYDSYPSKLGARIVKFLLSLKPEDYAAMDVLARGIAWVDGKQPAPPKLVERYTALGFVNLEVATRNASDWYCLLHRVQGAAALPAIQNGRLKNLVEKVEFLDDELFCEWAYFTDFEKQTLETWHEGELWGKIGFSELGSGHMDELIMRYQEENGE